MDNDDIFGPPMTDADPDLGYSLEELRAAVKVGLESGTSKFTTMAELLAECHRRFDAEKGGAVCQV